jgi:SagB-type dehydrogenase family enzyme
VSASPQGKCCADDSEEGPVLLGPDVDSDVSDALLAVAFASTAYKAIDPWTRSTGFRTMGLRHENLTATGEPRPAEDFLVSSRLVRNDREIGVSIEDYFTDESVAMLSVLGREPVVGLGEVALPNGAELPLNLGTAVMTRRSTRIFTGDAMRLDWLSALMQAGGGVTADANVHLLRGGDADLHFRSAPSGGGLYPNDLWIAALDVETLERGLYKYRATDHRLVRTGDEVDLLRMLGGIDVPDELVSVSRAAAIFIIVGNVWHSMRKYGNRGMRFMLIEVGAIAENIHLAAVALGLGTVDFSAFYDDEVNEAMEFDGVHRAALHMIIVGTPG